MLVLELIKEEFEDYFVRSSIVKNGKNWIEIIDPIYISEDENCTKIGTYAYILETASDTKIECLIVDSMDAFRHIQKHEYDVADPDFLKNIRSIIEKCVKHVKNKLVTK